MAIWDQITSGGWGNIGAVSSIGRILTRSESRIGDVEIDSILKSDHAIESTLSQFPIETGANIVDHISIDPRVITVSGIVSNVENSGFFDYSLGMFTGEQRSVSAWESLKRLQTERQLLTLVTNLETLSSMVITSLAATQDKDSSLTLRFIATLTEVVQVEFVQGVREQRLTTNAENVGSFVDNLTGDIKGKITGGINSLKDKAMGMATDAISGSVSSVVRGIQPTIDRVSAVVEGGVKGSSWLNTGLDVGVGAATGWVKGIFK